MKSATKKSAGFWLICYRRENQELTWLEYNCSGRHSNITLSQTTLCPVAVSSWGTLLFSGSGTYHKMLEICRETSVLCKWQDLLQGHTEGLDKPIHIREFCRNSHNHLRAHCPERATNLLALSSLGKTSRTKLPQKLKVLLVPQTENLKMKQAFIIFLYLQKPPYGSDRQLRPMTPITLPHVSVPLHVFCSLPTEAAIFELHG